VHGEVPNNSPVTPHSLPRIRGKAPSEQGRREM
jgi:hypothetical protein